MKTCTNSWYFVCIQTVVSIKLYAYQKLLLFKELYEVKHVEMRRHGKYNSPNESRTEYLSLYNIKGEVQVCRAIVQAIMIKKDCT